MGKSTHTNLWNKHLGTPVLNGDPNLLQLAANLAFTSALTARIPVCRLKCTKSTAAVETMRQWIDLQDSLP
jgi:hypothetical protein